MICFVSDISCLFLLFSEIAIACKLLTRQIDCRRVRGAGLTAPPSARTTITVSVNASETAWTWHRGSFRGSYQLGLLLQRSSPCPSCCTCRSTTTLQLPAVRALPALVNPLDIRDQDVVVPGEKTRCRIFEIRNTIFYGRSL